MVFFHTVFTTKIRHYILTIGENADTHSIIIFVTLLTVRKKLKQEDKSYFSDKAPSNKRNRDRKTKERTKEK